ncbi:MAG TPA: LmbE family protein, partial [Pirellulales bacterium]
EKTPMASPDHFQAVQITDAAVFYSRLTKWDADFEGTAPHTIGAQYSYYLGYRKLDLGPQAHFVVDVSDVYEQKLEAVRCYETQFPPAKVLVFERLRAFNRMQGLAAGFQFGEILFTHQAIGVRDLVEYAFGGKQL